MDDITLYLIIFSTSILILHLVFLTRDQNYLNKKQLEYDLRLEALEKQSTEILNLMKQLSEATDSSFEQQHRINQLLDKTIMEECTKYIMPDISILYTILCLLESKNITKFNSQDKVEKYKEVLEIYKTMNPDAEQLIKLKQP